uniref:Large ribosomal subunit protein uL16m n=1 Tax=Anser brachyrhynchus TaxID=132585 RepID=A0A8B9CZ21_9AVES
MHGPPLSAAGARPDPAVPAGAGGAAPRAALRSWAMPPDYSGVTFPERTKLKFMEKVPAVPKVQREPRRLRDIRGPSRDATELMQGQYGILALGGGYLHWGHFEMIRLTIGRCMDPKTMFAVWRVPAPHKAVTRKSLGHRMGGGKGPIDHYVTAVARKLPFPAIPVSRDSLQQMRREEEERRLNNQNPWTFERVVTANMLGMRKYLSPRDLELKGRYWGKYFLKHRV